MHLCRTLHGLERHLLLADACCHAIQCLVLHRHLHWVGRGRVGVWEVLQISGYVKNPHDFTDPGGVQWCRGEGSESSLIMLMLSVTNSKLNSVCAELFLRINKYNVAP
jgi:hypothetical protein